MDLPRDRDDWPARARGLLGRLVCGRGEWAWVPVVYALVVLWLYRDLWHQRGVATGFGWDTIDTHGPDLDFMARELREGRFSLWNPYDKGGYAVYADPIVCRYYPLAWLFIAWGAVFGTSWWLVQIEVLAHHVAIAACMHAFLRSRGLPVRAALLGGVGLVASAPILIHKASNILWPLAWVPLVWIAIDAAVARPTWRRGVAVAAAFALCMTAGSPPGLFYAGLLVLPYAVWRAVAVRPPRRQLVICAAAGAVVAGLVVAVTVIPTHTLVGFASRDRWAKGDAFALSLSFDWHGVIRGVFAHAAGVPEMYVGGAIALLAGCALVAPPRDGRAPQLFALIAIAGVVLVAGSTLPVLPWLVHHAPGFAALRIPGRYKMLTAWSLAAMAGYGAAWLGERDRDARPWMALVAVAAGLVASVIAVASHGSSAARPAWWTIAAMAVPCALVAAAVCVPRLAGAVGWALVVVVLLDAPSFIHRPDSPPPTDPRQLHGRDGELLARLDGIRDRFRLHDEFILGERVGQRRGVRDFRGYPALDPLSNRRYVDVLEHARHDAAIVTDYNVRWVLQAPHFRYGFTTSYLPQLAGDPAFIARGGGIFEARYPAPLVAWYGAVTVAAPADVLAAMRAAQAADGTRTRAVIEPGALATAPELAELVTRSGAAAAPGDVTDRAGPDEVDGALVSYAPDEIDATIDAPRAGLAVLNELAFPGWTVELDGAPAQPLVANYLLRAVYVGPGHHAIRWRFEPPAIHALLAGYLAALAIMLAAAAWPRRRTRSLPAPALPSPS